MGITTVQSGTSDTVPEHSNDASKEHSSSYEQALNFITRSLSKEMLDTAEYKVSNAKNLFDWERAELTVIINERRSALK